MRRASRDAANLRSPPASHSGRGTGNMIELDELDAITIVHMADGKANAISLEFGKLMTARFEELSRSSTRAIVITGSGRIFSAGVDLLRLLDGGVPYLRAFLPAVSTMLATVFTHPKPVVAAINGHAIAGGCVLACAADRRLMARDAGRIGVTELLVGVPFPPSAMEIMRCACVPQYFEDAIFSGATYPPPQALERGLIHELVEAEGLIDRAIAAAGTLAALPPTAFALTKRQPRQLALERLASAETTAAV